MYIDPGWGQMIHWFSKSLIFNPTAHFLQNNFPLDEILTMTMTMSLSLSDFNSFSHLNA